MVYDPTRNYMTLFNGDFELDNTNGSGVDTTVTGWAELDNGREAVNPTWVQTRDVIGPEGTFTTVARLFERDQTRGAVTMSASTSDTVQSNWRTVTFEFDFSPGFNNFNLGQHQVRPFIDVNGDGRRVNGERTFADAIERSGANVTRIDGTDWYHYEVTYEVDSRFIGENLGFEFYVNSATRPGPEGTTDILIDNAGISYEVICLSAAPLSGRAGARCRSKRSRPATRCTHSITDSNRWYGSGNPLCPHMRILPPFISPRARLAMMSPLK